MNWVIVDEKNNSGAQVAFDQGDTKAFSFFFQGENHQPLQLPYTATDIEVHIPGVGIKNFANGVSWLTAYYGFYLTLSDTETAQIPAGRQAVAISVKVITPSGVSQYDIANAFLVSAPLVG